MISKFITEFKGQWDKILPFLVFAYNDTANKTLGFLPHWLIYGRSLRGFGKFWRNPGQQTQKMKHFWNLGIYSNIMKICVKVSNELCNLLTTRLKLISTDTNINSTNRYKHQFDKHSTVRSLDVNDDVKVMIPTTNCKLTAEHEGPYKILKKISEINNFVISRNGKPTRFHINMLRKFHDRKNTPWNMDTT